MGTCSKSVRITEHPVVDNCKFESVKFVTECFRSSRGKPKNENRGIDFPIFGFFWLQKNNPGFLLQPFREALKVNVFSGPTVDGCVKNRLFNSLARSGNFGAFALSRKPFLYPEDL